MRERRTRSGIRVAACLTAALAVQVPTAGAVMPAADDTTTSSQASTSTSTTANAATPASAATERTLPAIDTASRLRFNGYGTVGLSWLDQPHDWGFRRDISESGDPGKDVSARIDSRLGLQLNYAVSERIELVTQAVLRARNDHSASAAFEWAFAAFRPTPDWTVRLGRVNPDAFLLSDYRNVGFAYPWVRPEVGFYGTIPLYTIVGGDVAKSWVDGGALWRAKAFYGGGKIAIAPHKEGPGATSQLDPTMGLSLTRELDGLTLRASVARARVAARGVQQLEQLDQGLAAMGALPIPRLQAEVAEYRRRLALEPAYLNFLQLGARYEGDDWLWSAEFANIWGKYAAGRMLNGYFSLGRRWGPVTLYGVVAASRSRDSVMQPPQWGAMLGPVIGPEMAALAQMAGDGAAMAINAHRQQQRSLSLGMRWDLAPRVALKMQWDRYLVAANGTRAFRNAANQAGSVNVASVVLDFVF